MGSVESRMQGPLGRSARVCAGLMVMMLGLLPALASPQLLYMQTGSGMRLAGDHGALLARAQEGASLKLLIRGVHGELQATCIQPRGLPDGKVVCEVQLPCPVQDPELPEVHQHLISVDSLGEADDALLVPSQVGGWQLFATGPRPARVQWLLEGAPQ